MNRMRLVWAGSGGIGMVFGTGRQVHGSKWFGPLELHTQV